MVAMMPDGHRHTNAIEWYTLCECRDGVKSEILNDRR